MPEPLTKKILEKVCCNECGANEDFYFHSRCHPSTPTWVVFKDGLVHVTCAECDELIVIIKIADE